MLPPSSDPPLLPGQSPARAQGLAEGGTALPALASERALAAGGGSSEAVCRPDGVP